MERRCVIIGGAAALAVAALPSCSAQPSAVTTKRRAKEPTRAPTSDTTPSAEQPIASVSQVSQREPLPVNDPQSGAEAYLLRRGSEVVMRSATCTHQGCIVAWSAADRLLRCPCHGATYDAWTGEVLSGPAPDPLREIPVRVRTNQIYLA